MPHADRVTSRGDTMIPPVTLLSWGGAALSILLLLYLLVVRQWSTVRASLAAALCALFVAAFVYKASSGLLIYESLKGLWSSVSIIAVIFPAILIYEVSREAGCFSAIQRDLTRLIPDKLLQVLALGWCFSSFLQGPSGFGVPIAVTAPLLIGIGVKPFWAVLIPLMGHAWANTFGTLGLGWEALVQQTALQTDAALFQQTALWTAVFTGMLCILAAFIICWFYRKGEGLRHGFVAVVILGTIMAGGQLLLCRFTPTLCVVIPTTVALGAAFFVARLPNYAHGSLAPSPLFEENQTGTVNSRLTLHEALLPYYILVAISIVTLLTPPIQTFLGSWKMSFSFPETSSGYGFVNPAATGYSPVAWLTHSGFFLLVAALLSWGYFLKRRHMRAGLAKTIWGNTCRKALPASLSVALLLVMSKLMSGSGQVEVLAAGTADSTGSLYALLAPAVGTLGSFMSSSNVSSNILFGSFQESIARIIMKSQDVILAAQTSGAAIGTMFSPSKVLLATITAGIPGQEGAIIRKLLAVALLAACIMGIMTYLYS